MQEVNFPMVPWPVAQNMMNFPNPNVQRRKLVLPLYSKVMASVPTQVAFPPQGKYVSEPQPTNSTGQGSVQTEIAWSQWNNSFQSSNMESSKGNYEFEPSGIGYITEVDEEGNTEMLDKPDLESDVELSPLPSQTNCSNKRSIKNLDDFPSLFEWKKKELKHFPSTFLIQGYNPRYVSRRYEMSQWLTKIHLKYDFETRTLYLALNILDRAMGKLKWNQGDYYLAAISCLLIATKYEETNIPCYASTFASEYPSFTTGKIIELELKILMSLDWRVTILSHFDMLEALCLNGDDTVYFTALFFLNLGFTNFSYLTFTPSIFTKACVSIANMVCSKEQIKEVDDSCIAFMFGLLHNEMKEPSILKEKFSNDYYDKVFLNVFSYAKEQHV